ncbi:unnamed protein product [Mytilus coruscus]|uniref:Uncharacterized protein n=1 Tax=Mytilus coruscus TaxID=42192 RepID=A0A6J8D9I0_MYTCO|nr:unnamed protein product [Mytilus coruscus]
MGRYKKPQHEQPATEGICKPCRTSHPSVISTRSQMYRTATCRDDTESIELANLAFFFPTQSTATLSSHEEWEPEMSCLEKNNDYSCGECGLTFVCLHEYNIQQDIGNHNVGHTDRVKVFWSSKCTNIKESMTSVLSKSTDQTSQTAQCTLNTGWSLKGKRINKRFSIVSKTFY